VPLKLSGNTSTKPLITHSTIFLSALFLNTLSRCSFLNERNQVSQPYKIKWQKYYNSAYLKVLLQRLNIVSEIHNNWTSNFRPVSMRFLLTTHTWKDNIKREREDVRKTHLAQVRNNEEIWTQIFWNVKLCSNSNIQRNQETRCTNSCSVGRGRAGRPDHDQQQCYHHVPTVNQRLLLQLWSSWWWAWGCPKHVELYLNNK
jgi:hypothetical protein